MELFTNEAIDFDLLKKRAYNYRWAEVAEGVIPLTAADPDFKVAKEITDTLIAYLSGGYLSYTPKLGIQSVKVAVAKALKAYKQQDISADLILPIDSAARAMYVTAQAVLQAGDEVLVFDPLDYLFNASISSVGAVSVYVPVEVVENHLVIDDLEKYITNKTKMITLCNPHNPLGMVYSKEQLQIIVDLVIKYDLWVMNDEIWSDIVYEDGTFNSIVNISAAADQKIISVYGFSKAFGIAGLRAGVLYTHNQEVFQKCIEVSQVMSTAGGISSLAQIAMEVCVNECYYWTQAFVKHLQSNRDYALERIAAMPLITCHKPVATYLLFPNISATNMSSEEFSELLLAQEKLAIVPGSVKFFGPGANGHIRICFATSYEVLKEGLDRLERALISIGQGR